MVANSTGERMMWLGPIEKNPVEVPAAENRGGLPTTWSTEKIV